jgi:hypothetical protein
MDDERDVTIWSHWPGEWWVLDRSYPLRYLRDVYGRDLDVPWSDDRGREYRLFEQGEDPNGVMR